MTVTYDPDGVRAEQVGSTYDIAIGYLDPTTSQVSMIGYVVSPSGNEQEGTDVTDETHLVQIASPNSTDRVARFPEISQGDWSKGERQRVFVDPTMYYQSDGGVDVSTPGNLVLFPAPRTDAISIDPSSINACPIQTDGTHWFMGINSGGNNLAIGSTGAPVLSSSTCNNHEIIDLLYTPFALIGLTNEGLWVIVYGTPPTSSHLVTDTIPYPSVAQRSLAYLDDIVYYLKNDSGNAAKIETYKRTGGVTSTFYTTTDSELYINCICSTASGIFFSTSSKLPFQNFFYNWSGAASDTPQRIYEVQGRVEYAVEALGTVYVLVRQFQIPYNTAPKWTLYAVVGNQVSVVDDARFLTDPNFAPNCVSVKTFDGNTAGSGDFKPMMWSDGRFLYIAWPGLATKRIDLVAGGISQIGTNSSAGGSNVAARRFLTTVPAQYVDVSAFGSGVVINQYYQTPVSGYVTNSFDDYTSPGTGKIFRSVEYQSVQALVGTQAISMAYRLNQNASWTSLTTRQIGPRNFSAPFPADVKGTEVQIKVTLTGDASAGSPELTSMSVIASLGRVIDITVSCRRNQQARSQDQASISSGQYTGKQLQANIMNIRNLAGGRCYAFIPDPTSDTGVTAIQARLLDYKRITPNGAATGQRSVDGDLDMECDLGVQLVEDFDP